MIIKVLLLGIVAMRIRFVLVAQRRDITPVCAKKDFMATVYSASATVRNFISYTKCKWEFNFFTVCPNGTYWHSPNLCKPCPDINQITLQIPAINVSACVCKHGFQSKPNNNGCEVISCPPLNAPQNGYFITHRQGCGNVINTACGVRCKSGYHLEGSSIRLCQQNGSWSGEEAQCSCK